MNTLSTTHNQRNYLIDLIRLTSAFCISLFHLIEFTESITYPHILGQSFFSRHTIDFIKWICFHGHTAFFLAFFMIGYKGLRLRAFPAYLLFAILGYIIILFGFYESPYPYFYWDVYPFLIFTLLTIFAFHRYSKMIYVWLMLFLITSYWNPLTLQSEILGGICTSDYQSAWPLFPWLFIATFLFEWGKLLSFKNLEWQKRALQISTPVFFLLSFTALFLFDAFASFATVSPTSDLYCKLQNLNFLEKLILFLGWSWLFQIAVYFKPQTQSLNLLSRSAWNQSFGLAYLLHLCIISIYLSQADFFLSTGARLDLSWLGILILVELFYLLFKTIRMKFHKMNM